MSAMMPFTGRGKRWPLREDLIVHMEAFYPMRVKRGETLGEAARRSYPKWFLLTLASCPYAGFPFLCDVDFWIEESVLDAEHSTFDSYVAHVRSFWRLKYNLPRIIGHMARILSKLFLHIWSRIMPVEPVYPDQ